MPTLVRMGVEGAPVSVQNHFLIKFIGKGDSCILVGARTHNVVVGKQDITLAEKDGEPIIRTSFQACRVLIMESANEKKKDPLDINTFKFEVMTLKRGDHGDGCCAEASNALLHYIVFQAPDQAGC